MLRLVLRTQPRSKKSAQAAKPVRSITTNEHDWDWRTERPVLLYAKANQRRESKSNRGSKLHQLDRIFHTQVKVGIQRAIPTFVSLLPAEMFMKYPVNRTLNNRENRENLLLTGESSRSGQFHA